MEKFNSNEKIKELRAKIKNITLDEMKKFSESWKTGYIAGLHKYSFFNYCIASFQLKADVTALAPFKKWAEKGFNVKKGQKAVQIFAPLIKEVEVELADGSTKKESQILGYRLVPVFDLSQTDGDISKLDVFSGGLVGNYVKGVSCISLEKIISLFNVPVEFFPVSSTGGNGWTDGKKIAILDRPDENDKIATYIHELAHYNLHFSKEENRLLDTATKEVEAETVSYLVSNAIGLENEKSAMYIKNWSDFSDKVRINKIMSVTEKILSKIFDSEIKPA